MNDDLDLEKALDLTLWEKLRLWPALSVMKQILLRFWNDPAYFTGLCRSLSYTIAMGVLTGQIPVPASISKQAWWTAVFLPALAFLFPAGQTNKSEGEIKAIAIDPTIAPKRP